MRRLAKQVKQFRYYGDKNAKNSLDPNKEGQSGVKDPYIDRVSLTKNNIFAKFAEISQLGIQTLPGTEFYLNESTYPIVVGNTGIYELNVAGIADITNIKFEPKSIVAIDNSPTAYLIIDIIYDDEE